MACDWSECTVLVLPRCSSLLLICLNFTTLKFTWLRTHWRIFTHPCRSTKEHAWSVCSSYSAHQRLESKSRLCNFLCFGFLLHSLLQFSLKVFPPFPPVRMKGEKKSFKLCWKVQRRSLQGQDETSCAEGENSYSALPLQLQVSWCSVQILIFHQTWWFQCCSSSGRNNTFPAGK